FVLSIPSIRNAGVKDVVSHETETLHALYLLATGTPTSYEEFRQKMTPLVAITILVDTESEMNDLFELAQIEVEAGLDKAFEIVRLPEPTLSSKTAMLDEIMARPDVDGLKFTFDAKDIVDASIPAEEHQNK